MKIWVQITAVLLLLVNTLLFFACGGKVETATTETNTAPTIAVNSSVTPEPSPSPRIPNAQAELLDNRNKTTTAPIGNFDFKNFTYPLPGGWQDSEGEVELVNGKRPMEYSEDEKRIGMSYVTTKFLDMTGD